MRLSSRYCQYCVSCVNTTSGVSTMSRLTCWAGRCCRLPVRRRRDLVSATSRDESGASPLGFGRRYRVSCLSEHASILAARCSPPVSRIQCCCCLAWPWSFSPNASVRLSLSMDCLFVERQSLRPKKSIVAAGACWGLASRTSENQREQEYRTD